MACAFIGAHLGLENQESDHAAYLNHWIRRLEGDSRLIFSIASAARQAAEFLGLSDEQEGDLETEAEAIAA